MREKYPGVDVVPVDVDGILNGGGYQARDIALKRMFSIADKTLEPEKDAVNIVGYYDTPDKVMARADDTERLIEGLGLHVNTLFLNDVTAEEFKRTRKGSVNLMFFYSVYNRRTCQIIENEMGIPWFEKPMPVGLAETLSWIDEFGKYMNVPADRRDKLKASMKEDYESFKKEYGGRFKGKKAVFYCPSATNINWALEILEILGVDVTNIYCPTISKWNHADEVHFADRGIKMEFDVNYDVLCERLEDVKPDMVLGADQMVSRLTIPHYYIRNPRTGVRSSLECGKRIVRMMEVSMI